MSGKRENTQMTKLVAACKGIERMLHSNVYIFLGGLRGIFLFCTINLHPKITMFDVWDDAYNLPLSLAIRGRDFFWKGFQRSKSCLVCMQNSPYFPLLRSSSLFPFTLILVLTLLLEHLDAIWGLRSLPGLPTCLRHSGLPALRASDGGAEKRMAKKKLKVEWGLQAPDKLAFLNSCVLLFQRTRNINFLEGFKNAMIAQSSGFCFFPCPHSFPQNKCILCLLCCPGNREYATQR